MKIGVNWSSPTDLEVVRSLIREGDVSFVEILIDNFLTVKPDEFLRVLGDTPVTFHIMNSRYLERDLTSLKEIGRMLRALITELKPAYVSDHIGHFSKSGRAMPMMLEIDYKNDFAQTAERLSLWQEILNRPVLVENFPSMLKSEVHQADFYGELLKKTGAGLLFDFSNAVIAEGNAAQKMSRWNSLISTSRHFHIGGYATDVNGSELLIDTHDTQPSHESIESMGRFIGQHAETLVVERDANIETSQWKTDINMVKAAIYEF